MTRPLRAARARLEQGRACRPGPLRPIVATTDRSVPVPQQPLTRGPSVLSALRGLRLCLSLWHRDDRFQGSVSEPDPRSRRLKAGCHAGRKCRSSPALVPGPECPGFDIVSVSTLHQRFTFVRLRGPHLTRSLPRLLTRRSPRRLLTAAARADLQPNPAFRLREACSHLRHSFSLHTARLFQNGKAEEPMGAEINMKNRLTIN